MSSRRKQTGIAIFEDIIGFGAVRGLKNEERRVLLCEGEYGGKRRPGEDRLLLQMAVEGADWEIHSCGDRDTTLQVFDRLDSDGDWGALFAVVDKDESRLNKLRKGGRGNRILVWPGARDLECFLLRSEAWKRVFQEFLPKLVNGHLYPKAEEGMILPRQFEIDETASMHGWMAHTKTEVHGKYPHVRYFDHRSRNEPYFPEYLGGIYCFNNEPIGFIDPDEVETDLPRSIIDLLDCLITGSYPVITDWGVAPEEERGLNMQGKRVISLLASRIFYETKERASTSDIEEWRIERLRRKLAITDGSHCSRLREMILHEVRGDEIRSAFPELSTTN